MNEGCPDLIRIMLDPSGLWKVLRKFSLCHTAHLTLFIKKDTPVARCSRIQCHDISSHSHSSFIASFYS
mgnify:CR=1 FL=1